MKDKKQFLLATARVACSNLRTWQLEIESVCVALKGGISTKENVDFAESIINYKTREAAYQAAIQATAKVKALAKASAPATIPPTT